MSAIQPTLNFTQDRVQAHWESKRGQIQRYFEEHLGELISSRALHMKYGSSVRTRISEINRDKECPIWVNNKVKFTEGQEQSVYWGTRR